MLERMFALLRASLFSRSSAMQDEDRHTGIILRRVRELMELTPGRDVPIVNGANTYIRLSYPQALGTRTKEISAQQHHAESGTDGLGSVQGHE